MTEGFFKGTFAAYLLYLALARAVGTPTAEDGAGDGEVLE